MPKYSLAGMQGCINIAVPIQHRTGLLPTDVDCQYDKYVNVSHQQEWSAHRRGNWKSCQVHDWGKDQTAPLKILVLIQVSYPRSRCLVLGFLSLLRLFSLLTWISTLFFMSRSFCLSLTSIFCLILKPKQLHYCSERKAHHCSQGNVFFPWL